MSNLTFYLSQIIDGIAYGSIYGIFALCIVLLYRANKIFNFAQTELATLCTIGMFFLMKHFSFGVSFLITLVVSFLGGVFLHLTVMRFLTERKETVHASQTMITIALFSISSSVSAYILGDEQQAFPSMFGNESFNLWGVGISHLSVGLLCITILMVSIVYFGFKYTRIGLLLEAIAQNTAAARLRGIHASNLLALAWGMSVLMSAICGILLAPTLFLSPSMLTGVFVYALIAVVIGGLESPLGAFVGGIIVGVFENLVTNISFIGSQLKFVSIFVLLVFVLLVRPRGLWGRAEGRKV